MNPMGFIVVGSGEWAGSGVMAMSKRGLFFGARRGSVATVFSTRLDAKQATDALNAWRIRNGYGPISVKLVRLIPRAGR